MEGHVYIHTGEECIVDGDVVALTQCSLVAMPSSASSGNLYDWPVQIDKSQREVY